MDIVLVKRFEFLKKKTLTGIHITYENTPICCLNINKKELHHAIKEIQQKFGHFYTL